MLLVKYKKLCSFTPKINISNLKTIISFLINIYEFDQFSKILVTVGIAEASEVSQIELYSKISKFYIIRWLPGMLTSRYIMARDFVRSTPPKSAIVRYNLKYMKTTVLKLYNLPDLLVLTNMTGMGSIIAKEAVLMKVPTIGLANNNSFPEKIAFRFFGDISNLNFIKSFLSLISLGIKIGNELGIQKNIINYNALDLTKNYEIKNKEEKVINDSNYYLNFNFKSKIMNTSFDDLKLSFFFLKKIKKKKFKNFYNNLKFSSEKKSNSKKLYTKSKILNLIFIQNLSINRKRIRKWFNEKKRKIKKKNKKRSSLKKVIK